MQIELNSDEIHWKSCRNSKPIEGSRGATESTQHAFGLQREHDS